jgi:hypothetical protein
MRALHFFDTANSYPFELTTRQQTFPASGAKTLPNFHVAEKVGRKRALGESVSCWPRKSFCFFGARFPNSNAGTFQYLTRF